MNTSCYFDKTVTACQFCIRKNIANYWSWRSSSFDETSAQQQAWWEAYLAAAGEDKRCKVLDIGTGTGFIALGFAKAGHKVTGVDIAPGMLARARSKANLKGLEIDFLIADAENPPFPPKSFDVIVCRNLLWTLCNPDRALSHWYQLLRPGGRVIVSDGIWRISGLKGFFQKMRGYAKTILKNGVSSYPIQFEFAYRNAKKSLPNFKGMKAKDAEAILNICGFSNISRYDHLFDINPYPKAYGNDFFIMAAVKQNRFLNEKERFTSLQTSPTLLVENA
ncbi:MAG: class I SAM-dependent methyltransferase [Desulfosarcina sp.]|nr:class I SAM-dependent methyltransferase [Desulfosarcina sp.]MBC2742889.1 class I SAM-dependent methyltransferase [Desulfosarcina sp.]MBC2765799.1 class I SAM-dependent methyltransferase [Desulfosarcina sp.]